MMVVITLTLQAVTPQSDVVELLSTQTLTLMIPTPRIMVQSVQPSTTPTIVSDLTTTKSDQTTTISSHLDMTTMVTLTTTDMVPPSETWPSVNNKFTTLTAVQDPTVSTISTHTEYYEIKMRMLELTLLIRT